METLPAVQEPQSLTPIEAARRLQDGLAMAAEGRRQINALEDAERRERVQAWEQHRITESLLAPQTSHRSS